jgi:hypothetical protein
VSDFSASWELSRSRFVDTISGLNQVQLNWRIHSDCLSIGQMALHVAGVEVSFSCQLTDSELDAAGMQLKAAATDGVVNDNPFPYSEDVITPELVKEKMEFAKQMLGPRITHPTPQLLSKEIVSALGPIITGHGALSRLAFHSAYHQGQAYLMITAPGFPQ